MPCTNEGYPPTRKDILDSYAPAMLCAVLSLLNEPEYAVVLSRIDWKEAGVSRNQFEAWWNLHREEDQLRRAEEKRRTERDKLVKSARAKLTKEERKALGVR